MLCKDGCWGSNHLPRIFLSLLFIVGGAGFLMNFEGTTQFVKSGLDPWGLGGIAMLATVIAIVLKLGGGLMLLFNYQTSTAAWMLIAFTVLATVMFHLDWSGEMGQMQMTNFLKNLAIVGGLLVFANCVCPKCRANCKDHDHSTPATV